MLDADLAEIYGYSTKAFNRQVKNNIEKFDEDFRFQLTNNEIEELSRCKICTLELENSLKKSIFAEKVNLRCKKGMRTNSWTQLEDASCTLLKNKSPRHWIHFMI
jgi:hypothetical protein